MTVWNQSLEKALTRKRSVVEERQNPVLTQYTTDIREQCVHAEYKQLPALVDGHADRAHVSNRHPKALILHVIADILRKALCGDFVSVAGDSFDASE